MLYTQNSWWKYRLFESQPCFGDWTNTVLGFDGGLGITRFQLQDFPARDRSLSLQSPLEHKLCLKHRNSLQEKNENMITYARDWIVPIDTPTFLLHVQQYLLWWYRTPWYTNAPIIVQSNSESIIRYGLCVHLARWCTWGTSANCCYTHQSNHNFIKHCIYWTWALFLFLLSGLVCLMTI